VWAEEALGVHVTAAEIRPLLADVEETVARLIGLLRLPTPQELEPQ
jgi:hypothetical protein